MDLHDNLLAGTTGRFVNFIGGILVTLLGATGAVIWWPGIKHWRRSVTIDWKAHFQRFNWNLHSALGIWSIVFILLWGVSGIYLAWPEPFHALLDSLDPTAPSSTKLRVGDHLLYWLAQLHFGRFAGWYVKALWTVLGLVPAVLFVTGALMWWNRVLLKRGRQWHGVADAWASTGVEAVAPQMKRVNPRLSVPRTSVVTADSARWGCADGAAPSSLPDVFFTLSTDAHPARVWYAVLRIPRL